MHKTNLVAVNLPSLKSKRNSGHGLIRQYIVGESSIVILIEEENRVIGSLNQVNFRYIEFSFKKSVLKIVTLKESDVNEPRIKLNTKRSLNTRFINVNT